ncbi:glycosyltransferase [Roseicyclus sp.]|uniref:glycosyltransferase n=1 Tax=Roseicyclus sp. TaxID=1914329 RepID=UPI003FA07C15
MIFATVGTQLPFDRLLLGLDGWAARNPGVPVLAQAGASRRRFRHIETVGHLGQAEFRARLGAARLVVAHAGMGTILTAAELGKPLILMPRRAKFGEHRNDHQQDTVREMARLSNVSVVEDGEALHLELDRALARGFEVACTRTPDASDAPGAPGANDALHPLIDVIRAFVWDRPEGRAAGDGGVA